MKKVGLLFLALASCCAGAFAGDAYYLIKDGKLQNGASYEAGEGGAELTEGNEYATIKHNDRYKNVMLTGMEGLHVGTKNLIMEYTVDSDALLGGSSAAEPNKPNVMVNCLSDEKSQFNQDAFALVYSANDSDPMRYESYMISINNIDAKGEGIDQKWNTYNRYTFARNNKEVKAVIISYLHEVTEPSDALLKIKNLYFETNADEYPIYGSQFDANDYWFEPHIMYKKDDECVIYPTKQRQRAERDFVLDENGKKIRDTMDLSEFFFQDGLAITTDGELINFPLTYEAGNYSDESGIPMSEILTSLCASTVSNIYFKNIPLSQEVVKSGKIKVSCLVKKNPKDVDYELVGDITNEFIPIYVKFDNAEAIQLYKDSLCNGNWTKEVAEVEVPNGAKNVTVEFRPNPNMQYLVDDFLISYKGEVGVAKVNNDGKTLSIYPNPVLNEIAFYGIEDIQSVEIVSLNGAVKACTVVDNKVNVSGLAAGEYAIIVNKNITGKFIKK
ncbi:MAG: T9SS type A sorting domain-containing protein [Paludibacteraceae bacterium]|nr:T9SS type A sorting domain-containing protein [Paludibacteraceae bacterium]